MFNVDGSTNSEIATITLGDVPLAPPNAPTKDQLTSTTSRIALEYPALATALTSGLPITSLSLEIDENLSGAFEPVTGFTTPSLAVTHLATGLRKG